MRDQDLAILIGAAQAGDSAAFDRLIDQYADRVFGFLVRLSGSRDDAEDLTQEVFIRLVRTIGRYDHQGYFEAYLFRIASNLFRDRLRQRKRRGPTLSIEGADEDGGFKEGLQLSEETASASIDQSETHDVLQQALNLLPDAEREVVMLRHFSDLSFKEIAVLMDTPLGTALARAHRGLAKLKELLGGKLDGIR